MQYLHECPNCGCPEVEYLGLQWFPIKVFETWDWSPPVVDKAHPDEGAVRLYTCTHCETTFADMPAAALT